MRIRLPRGIGKDQIYLVLILGFGTGIYGWNSLIKEYVKEHKTELQLNEVINRIASNISIITYTSVILIKLYNIK